MIRKAIETAGGQSALARLIGAKPQEVWNWANGRPIPADRCPAIERATNGVVTCDELRNDVTWRRIKDKDWPHPKGRPLIDVAATAVN